MIIGRIKKRLEIRKRLKSGRLFKKPQRHSLNGNGYQKKISEVLSTRLGD